MVFIAKIDRGLTDLYKWVFADSYSEALKQTKIEHKTRKIELKRANTIRYSKESMIKAYNKHKGLDA